MYFRNKGPPKRLLDKSLKSRVLGDPSIDNMGNGLKHCSNLNDGTFAIYIDHCDVNCVGKIFL